MKESSVGIICPACGNDSFLKREPLYKGFTKIGETLSCCSCRYVFEEESAIPFKKNKQPLIFEEDERPAPAQVFRDDEKPEPTHVFNSGENKRLCRYCDCYVVNPFIQRCTRFKREVEATDTCDDFIQKPDTVEQ